MSSTLQDNLVTERQNFVQALQCAKTGTSYSPDRVHNLSESGAPLLVQYDLDAVGMALSRDALAQRKMDMWRYRELLPVRRCENIVSLDEIVTPLVSLPRPPSGASTAVRRLILLISDTHMKPHFITALGTPLDKNECLHVEGLHAQIDDPFAAGKSLIGT